MARKKKKPTSKNKRKRSGKGSRKKTSKETAPEAEREPTEVAEEHQPPRAAAEDGRSEPTAEAAAEPPDDEAANPAGETADPAPEVIDLDDDDTRVVDLDADSAEEVAEAIDRLIAETVATAPPEAVEEPEAPVIDLDADPEEGPVTASREAAGTTTPEPSSEAGDQSPDPAAGSPAGTTLEPQLPKDGAEEGLPLDAAAEAALRKLSELGPVSSPEVRDRLLAAALAHAEHKDARYRVPFSAARTVDRWKALAASVLLVIAAGVAVAPPDWVRPEPPAQLEPDVRARNLRMALLLQAQQVEAFRVRSQRLPATLDEVAETLPGVRYVRSGSRAYQLIVYEANGDAIVYDSTRPAQAFEKLTPGWAAPQAGS